MSKNVEFTTNFDTFDTFKEFKKEIRKQIIEEGLDTSLTLSVKELKTELQYLINKKIRMNDAAGNPTSRLPGSENNGLNQTPINIPKSDDELLKYLTKGRTDPSKYNKSKDFTGLNETGIVFGHNSKGQNASNRVTLRMEIEPDETVESQYQKATKFFSEALFALPGPGADMNYFINPGIDLSQFVKIKCSVLTGDGDKPTRKGLNPTQRFNKTKERGYADWTIKQEAIDAVRKNYINISEIMNLIKTGDLERASQVLTLVDKNQKLTDFRTQLDKLIGRSSPTSNFFKDEQGRWRIRGGSSEGGRFATIDEIIANIPVSTQAYMNAVKLVNGLKIVKKITQEIVTYSLFSDFDDFGETEVDFYSYIQKAMRNWGVEHENYWFNALVKKVEKLIKQYESSV